MTKEPNIVLLDIETAPSVGMYFDLWREGNIVSREKSWYILSFSYKQLGSSKTTTFALNDFNGYAKDKENDFKICQKLAEVLSDADIIIAHNGDGFDIPKINARLIKWGIRPPAPYQTIDTYKIAKRYFSFESNKLDDLGEYLGVGRKISTGGIKLWKGCMSGDKESWRLMKKYNAQDVVLLEKVYMVLRPWTTNHPNLRVYIEGEGCPVCGKTHVQRRGYSTTRTGRKQRFQCVGTTSSPGCGAWSHGKSEKIVTIR